MFYLQKSVNLTIADVAKRQNDDHAEYYNNLLKTRQATLAKLVAGSSKTS